MKRKYHIPYQKMLQMGAMLSLLALLLYLLPSESPAIEKKQSEIVSINTTTHFHRL